MGSSGDVERFDRWAETYERHWMQRLIFAPVQRTVLELAAQEVPRPRAVLDVGCGTGRLLRAAAAQFPAAELVGVDPASNMLAQGRLAAPDGRSIRFEQASAEQLPFPDAHFDLVFSTLTFHHWADQPKAVIEVGRVLAPGGRWLLADFIATGFMRYVRRFLRMRRFPERESLSAMLAPPDCVCSGRRRRSG